MDAYKTILKQCTWEQTIEKSRFIGIVYPVCQPSDVEEGLKHAHEAFPQARHYVYAYRIAEGSIEKSSDDGEPQGTGGRPVLDNLQHKGLWNILVVVVRYFGGVLLGTGGLSRAYGGTARKLLENAPIMELQDHITFQLDIAYALFEMVKYQLNLYEWEIGEVYYAESIRFEVYVPLKEAEDFQEWLNGYVTESLICQLIGHTWRGRQEKEFRS